MSGRRNMIAGTIGLLVAAGGIASGTLSLATGSIAGGVVTLLLATLCAAIGTANLTTAARARTLDEIVAQTEERANRAHATYAKAARIAENEITISDLAEAVDRWAVVVESERIAGATTEDAFITAFAVLLTHDRKAHR